MAQDPGSRRFKNDESRPGIIDTIGNAFALLSQRPYLIWLPVALDVYLWLGYGVSSRPLTDKIVQWLTDAAVDAQTIERVRELGEGFDLVGLAALVGFVSPLIPTMLSVVERNRIAGASGALWDELPWWTVPPVGLALIIVGIAIAMCYLTMIGSLVRNEPVRPTALLSQTVKNSMRMAGLIGVIIGLMLLLMSPLVFLGVLLLAVGVDPLPVLLLFSSLAATWAMLFFFFVQHAIVLSNAGPFRAIYLSYNVVRNNFWAAIGLIVATIVIERGTPIVLSIFTGSPWGVPFALIVHAFLGTGLVAAAMLFYRDRVRVLHPGRDGRPEPRRA